MDLLWVILYLAYTAVLVGVAYTDIRERRIPNKVMYPALLAALVFMFYSPGWRTALLGAALGAFVFFLPVVSFGRRGGMGDVKLAAFIGLILGLPGTFTALVIAVASAVVVGLVGVLLGKLDRRSTIPFAPFLALGALVTLAASVA